MTQEEKDKAFNSLYTNFYYTKVQSFDDYLLYYNIPLGYSGTMESELNKKIKELNLPLVATSNARNGIFKDSIKVTVKENE